MFQIAQIFVSFFGFLLRGVVYKAVLFGVIAAAVSVMVPWVIELMVSCACSASSIPTAINNLMSKFPAGSWFFIDLFNVGAGLQIMFVAYVTRFLIRRLPVIG